MGLLDDQISTDADFLLDDDQLAEPIAYRPRNGSPFAILAIVYRDQRRALDEAVGDDLAPYVEVVIRNKDLVGIARPDTGGDQVEFPLRLNEGKSIMNVASIISQDRGLWHLECR
jgi:hypothetical protein